MIDSVWAAPLALKLGGFFLCALALMSTALAGHPCAHVLICCRGGNEGITFLVNGARLGWPIRPSDTRWRHLNER